MEKPVHHDEQDAHREQARDGLNVQRGHARGEIVDDMDGGPPGQQRRDEREAGAGLHRPAVMLRRAHHADGDRREHQHALEAFAKYQDSDIEPGRAGFGGERIGHAVIGQACQASTSATIVAATARMRRGPHRRVSRPSEMDLI